MPKSQEKCFMSSQKNRGSLPMFKLTFPIAMEQFMRILVSSADTFMLSSYSNDAVAAVGLVSQYAFFLNLLFSVIGTGCTIVLAQYLGAQKSKKELNYIAQASSVMLLILSVIIMTLVFAFTKPLLMCYTLEESVRNFAFEYFIIYGGAFCFFSGFSLLQGAILRSYGHTNQAMIVSVVANIVNVLGNAISLYGWFGLPVLGVRGVAFASGFSMFVSCILFFIFIKQKDDVEFSFKGIFKVPFSTYKTILSVGLPTAGESLSYNVSQIVIMAMISTLGTYAMSAQVYVQTIVRFVFAVAVAMGNATQIKTGYFVGAKQNYIAYKKVYKYQLIATTCSMILITLAIIIKNQLSEHLQLFLKLFLL